MTTAVLLDGPKEGERIEIEILREEILFISLMPPAATICEADRGPTRSVELRKLVYRLIGPIGNNTWGYRCEL